MLWESCERLDRLLRFINLRSSSLQLSLSAAENASQPLHMDHLLPELLLDIFDLAVHSFFDPEQPSPSSGQTGAETALAIFKDDSYPQSQLQPGIIAHETNPFTPIHLSHVCKDWREMTLAAPELWSSIYIANGSPGTVKLFRHWLHQAGSRPLELVFRDTGVTSNTESGRDAVVEMLKIAAAHSEQWKSFKVRLLDLCLPLDDVIEALRGIATPKLEAIALSFNMSAISRGDFTDAWIPLVTNSPNLKHLQMWSAMDYSEEFLAIVPFSRLTTITLPMVMFSRNSRFIESLRTCKVLENMSVSLEDEPWGEAMDMVLQPPISGADAISIPSLRHLNLVGNRQLTTLLTNFHLPSLQTLSIHTKYERYSGRTIADVYLALEDLLTRSECQIHSFTIRDEDESNFEPRLLSTLQHPAFRSLRELRIGGIVGEDTLKQLTAVPTDPDLEGHEPLIQRLRHIHIEALSVVERTVFDATLRTMARPGAKATVGFLSQAQLEYAVNAWDNHVAEESLRGAEKEFYFASNLERARRLRRGYLCHDFSMIQGWRRE